MFKVFSGLGHRREKVYTILKSSTHEDSEFLVIIPCCNFWNFISTENPGNGSLVFIKPLLSNSTIESNEFHSHYPVVFITHDPWLVCTFWMEKQARSVRSNLLTSTHDVSTQPSPVIERICYTKGIKVLLLTSKETNFTILL